MKKNNCNLHKLQDCLVIRPAYTDQGYGTEVWLLDGRRYWLPNRPQTVVRWVLRSDGIDLTTWRQAHPGLTYTSPLVINLTHVWVPLRMLDSPVGRDGVYGYVNITKVKHYEVEEGDGESRPCCHLWLFDPISSYLSSQSRMENFYDEVTYGDEDNPDTYGPISVYQAALSLLTKLYEARQAAITQALCQVRLLEELLTD